MPDSGRTSCPTTSRRPLGRRQGHLRAATSQDRKFDFTGQKAPENRPMPQKSSRQKLLSVLGRRPRCGVCHGSVGRRRGTARERNRGVRVRGYGDCGVAGPAGGSDRPRRDRGEGPADRRGGLNDGALGCCRTDPGLFWRCFRSAAGVWPRSPQPAALVGADARSGARLWALIMSCRSAEGPSARSGSAAVAAGSRSAPTGRRSSGTQRPAADPALRPGRTSAVATAAATGRR